MAVTEIVRDPKRGPHLRVVHSRPEPLPALPPPTEAECQPCVEAAGMACAHTGDEGAAPDGVDLWRDILTCLVLLAAVVFGVPAALYVAKWWLL